MNEINSVRSSKDTVVQDFARSELFERTFREGMDLVETAAVYLDGAGRQESKLLSRNAALAYASESMRLTTRLMQVASWLLVQRAVREGDMSAEEAGDPRYRIGPKPAATRDRGGVSSSNLALEPLPEGLSDLVDRSERLYDRIAHLDRRMYLQDGGDDAPNPVLSQFERLRAAFDGGATHEGLSGSN
jgi:regulator of CtrA degradation